MFPYECSFLGHLRFNRASQSDKFPVKTGQARIQDGDDDGLSIVDMGAYEVEDVLPLNQAPIADAGMDFTVTIKKGKKVTLTLDGSGSYDPEGSELTYEWSEAGALLGNTAVLSLNRSKGTYTFDLKVTDDQGLQGLDQVIVTVAKRGRGL